MEQFVRVRMVQANAMDLTRFQFDYDLTFAAFFMNADGTIYGRFGSRSSQDAMADMSMPGFAVALEGALDIHDAYPSNAAALAGKQPVTPRYERPEQYPTLASYSEELAYEGEVVKSCMHCHQINEAERMLYRDAKEPVPDKVMFPWPSPRVIGMVLDRLEQATVSEIAPGSPADKAGFAAGDVIETIDGQPIVSIADVQWVLHHANDGDHIRIRAKGDGPARDVTVTLPAGWRKNTDISWRVSSWDVRRMGTGGLILRPLSAEQRSAANLDEGALGLRVDGIGQWSPHDYGKKAGFLKEDIIVSFDGQTGAMTRSQLLAYTMQETIAGDVIPVTVLREGARLTLELPTQ
jgi:serine protease Do